MSELNALSSQPLPSSSSSSSPSSKNIVPTVSPDTLLSVRQFKSSPSSFGPSPSDSLPSLLSSGPLSSSVPGGSLSPSLSYLNKVSQLTGFSDPVYAEATLASDGYDLSLSVLLVNQTNDTLSNLSLEIATLGDLELIERPGVYTLGPKASRTIHANVKVSSTDTGIIFGNILYEAVQSGSTLGVGGLGVGGLGTSSGPTSCVVSNVDSLLLLLF